MASRIVKDRTVKIGSMMVEMFLMSNDTAPRYTINYKVKDALQADCTVRHVFAEGATLGDVETIYRDITQNPENYMITYIDNDDGTRDYSDGLERTAMELAPCPFCGNQPIVLEAKIGAAVIKCINNECICNTPIFQNGLTAMEIWNTRVM